MKFLLLLGLLPIQQLQTQDLVSGMMLRKHKDGEIIVAIAPKFRNQFLRLLKSLGIHTQEQLLAQIHLLKASGQMEKVLRMLLDSGYVEYVEPNYIYTASFGPAPLPPGPSPSPQPTPTPTPPAEPPANDGSVNVVGADPLLANQYGLRLVAAKDAWKVTKGRSQVLVQVIDTGVDYNHPDLKDNIYVNKGESGKDASGRDKASNGIDDDGNGYADDVRGFDFANFDNKPMDDNMHGTHVAGIIAAKENNKLGGAGLAPKVKILPCKFMDYRGSGATKDAIKCIEYGIKMRVDVMNNSWGGYANSRALLEAIEKANNAGIVFVAAAGNEGNNNNVRPTFPASYKVANVISVAASDSRDYLAEFSNYGSTTVDISAPGVEILSTVPGGKYEYLDGTSMAAPFVSAAAALVRSVKTGLAPAEVKRALLNSADDVREFESVLKNAKRLNAYEAVSRL